MGHVTTNSTDIFQEITLKYFNVNETIASNILKCTQCNTILSTYSISENKFKINIDIIVKWIKQYAYMTKWFSVPFVILSVKI